MEEVSRFADLPALPEEPVADGITRRVIAGERGMIVWWTMQPGAKVAAHSHDHEQIAWVISGRMEFRLGAEWRFCGPGDIVVIGSGVEHEAIFPETTEVVDFFAPPREDFLAGGPPPYMADQ